MADKQDSWEEMSSAVFRINHEIRKATTVVFPSEHFIGHNKAPSLLAQSGMLEHYRMLSWLFHAWAQHAAS